MPTPIPSVSGRFARLETIEWWDQARLRNARVLVIGAGALGNEVIKNLALLGIGHLIVADMDRVELSNLSRSVLFRQTDEGQPKAVCAAAAARAIYPDIHATELQGNVLSDVGLGYFRWADAVIGALDNREARVFVNSACARVSRPWIDGGIEVLQGIVRGFAPPATACYECTMSQVDWDLLNKRRSCSLLARRAQAQNGTPTTPTTASIIAAFQVQELIKFLHGFDNTLLGRGVVVDGSSHASYLVNYPIHPQCPWHEPAPQIACLPLSSRSPLAEVWAAAEERLGTVHALDLSRELVEALSCPRCGDRISVFQPLDNVDESRARCAGCGAEMTPEFFHSILPGSPLLQRSAAEIGLPGWDIIWARNHSNTIGLEIGSDKPSALA